MDDLSITDARRHFSEVINRVADEKERVVITRRGKAIAAIVPIEDAELLRDLEDRIDLADAEIALAEAREFGTIPWETVKAELGLS
ncbi:MAG: type II toxin-antitoxin system Phd/YefM family antitoxin [Thermomicrobiales bacterium]